jgi:UDP-N-acetylglucosamine--N-acetylmuramyl-(pentapeptide) pyrophosphoryl-undecaprenol N-acetylglucosamine transferase
MNSRPILLAGGGTGGHVFPMVAVADALRALAPALRVVFVGTQRGLETKLVPERGYELELMRVEPLRGGGLQGAWRGALRAAAAIPEARALLKRLAPGAVFSVGGYAAGPVSLAARTLGVPLALLEPNAVIGLSNRLLAPLVQRAYTAFAESERHFRRAAVLRSGVPIRSGFEPRPYRRDAEALRVLVLGGSQGARALNESVPDAWQRVSLPLSILHQCGPAHEPAVRERYRALGAAERVQVVAFIDDMARALATADLVVSRAGASALGEICAVGRPSILVPYPFAAGDHQRHNALALQRAGAAVCIPSDEATAERISRELERLWREAGLLSRMARRAQALGRPRAALTIAEDLLALSGVQARAEQAAARESAAAAPTPPERLALGEAD